MHASAELAKVFAEQQRPLWGLCYRMIGSAADADEIVQETFVRVLERPPADASRPLAPWLRTIALNLARDRLRRRRETHVGAFLPEPVASEELERSLTAAEARITRQQSATWAFLLALETLNDKQRAVLVLRDVYDLDTRETAAALGLSQSHVKVLLHRARGALKSTRATEPWDPPEAMPSARMAVAREAITRFFAALASDDVAAMTSLLRDDVVFVSDGNGEVHAARVPIFGVERVIRFHRRTRQLELPKVALAAINYAPALVYDYTSPIKDGVPPRGVIQCALSPDEKIARLWAMAAPSKLHRLFRAEPLTPASYFDN